jgi:serine protease Do
MRAHTSPFSLERVAFRWNWCVLRLRASRFAQDEGHLSVPNFLILSEARREPSAVEGRFDSAKSGRALSAPWFWFAASLAVVLCLGQTACADQSVTVDPPAQAQRSPQSLPSFADVVEKVLPAVVNITAVRRGSLKEEEQSAPNLAQSAEPPLEQFLRRFFGQLGPLGVPDLQGPAARIVALGSGFIIDPEGYIVTDTHVIAHAEKVSVLLQDNSRYPARIVGQDEMSDLALLKIDAGRPLPVVVWGDSDAARVGDWILAVGNPFGLGGTVTAGIISARGRDIRAGLAEDFLQIDAPLNQGNSGGPTFNLAGEVIGINTAIYTPSGGSVGIGFAIPSKLARPVIDQLRARGKIVRGWLGVELQEITPRLAQVIGLAKAQGALVVDVTPGAPADRAGIRQGDVIIAYNARTVERPRDLANAVAASPVGKAASVTVWRVDKTLTLTAFIAERPQAAAEAAPTPAERPMATAGGGVRFSALTDDLRRELGLPPTEKGAVVAEIDPGSPLADSGLAIGDVIEEINHHPVTTPQSAAARLREALSTKEQNLLLLVNREGSKQYLAWSARPAGNVD